MLESLEDVPPLRSEPAAFPGDTQEATVTVVLRLEEPGRVVEWLSAWSKQDRFDQWEGAVRSSGWLGWTWWLLGDGIDDVGFDAINPGSGKPVEDLVLHLAG